MWKQARAQEKRLRVLIVDYRRRAERRREFYEKFKADPAQFMQVHGRKSVIHMDAQITASAENCLMPWQGNEDNMIDRFDARAHLDRIPEPSSSTNGAEVSNNETPDDPALNYERYRILIQNELCSVSEDKFLHQIYIEEQFGTPTMTIPHAGRGGGKGGPADKSKIPKAAIGYCYEDSTPATTPSIPTPSTTTTAIEDPDEESDEDIDFDLLVNLEDLNLAQQAELNNGGVKYGLAAGDFMKFLNADLEEKEQMRLAKLQEEEKQTMSGRKARRERRAYKDRIILRKGYVSPPSYAVRANSSSLSPVESKGRQGRSESRSKSKSNSPEKITFITSFGNESDDDKKRGKTKTDSSKSSTIIGPSLPQDPPHGPVIIIIKVLELVIIVSIHRQVHLEGGGIVVVVVAVPGGRESLHQDLFLEPEEIILERVDDEIQDQGQGPEIEVGGMIVVIEIDMIVEAGTDEEDLTLGQDLHPGAEVAVYEIEIIEKIIDPVIGHHIDVDLVPLINMIGQEMCLNPDLGHQDGHQDVVNLPRPLLLHPHLLRHHAVVPGVLHSALLGKKLNQNRPQLLHRHHH